ncbi:MAG: SHOCT domain-containing protein [Oscillospiraceae bacterium]|nr:SHOCT domain-containing protein [Oscillospiraceae bacterium]MDD7278086.1 SHOCT domain-containing protein [Oscillospiraceae bacterium]MDY2863557.1 SHOCT domain-containing protein [Oscillospiraceae bacterium]
MNEQILTAKINCKMAKKYNIVMILVLIAGILFLIPGKESSHVGYGGKTYYYTPSLLQFCSYESAVKIAVSIFIVFIIILGIRLYFQDMAKASSLELYSDRIQGRLRLKGHISDINIPIDKIDSIFVQESVFDRMRSGKTICLRSVTGAIQFICVQNADEFVNAVNESISKNKSVPQNTVTTTASSSTTDELKKYKELLDSGVITQEEFDAKKKQLLGI